MMMMMKSKAMVLNDAVVGRICRAMEWAKLP